MFKLFAALRLIAAAAGLVAVTATFLDTGSREAINPFNFFGFFTMQSNIFAAAVFAVAAVAGLSSRPRSRGLEIARGCAVTYMVIVGLVYNLLLAGLPGGVDLPWANGILHVVIPIYATLDWLLLGDRGPLPWNRFWIVFVYPLAWVGVVLVRGATDGWVPYPFLDPQTGYGTVSIYVVAIAVGIGVVGALVWTASRLRIVETEGYRRADAPAPALQRNWTGSPGA